MAKKNQNQIKLTQDQAEAMISDYKEKGLPIPEWLAVYGPSKEGSITVLVRRNGRVFDGHRIVGEVTAVNCDLQTSGPIIPREKIAGEFNGLQASISLSDFPEEVAEEDESRPNSEGYYLDTYQLTLELSGTPVLSQRNSAMSATEMQIVGSSYRISKVEVGATSPLDVGNMSVEEILEKVAENAAINREERAAGLMSWAANQESESSTSLKELEEEELEEALSDL